MRAKLAILFVFVGCCSNVVFLELLVKEDPGSGNLVTFLQFLFIAVEGFITTMKFGTKKSSIPMQQYVILVTFFFIVSLTNNYALNFNISMPLHMIFRAGSLMANMILGILILKRTYLPSKYVSVGMISMGIALCTIASGNQVGGDKDNNKQLEETGVSEFAWWLVGISLLTFALFMSARMGIYQEVIYKEFGKFPREALFFTHALPLPGFLLLWRDLLTHSTIASASPILIYGIPRMWVYLAGNVITQAVCINSVFILTTECPSLTVTLVVTLRKFFSLLFSIAYFKNPFTVSHWIGTLLVFVGTGIFTEVHHMIMGSKPAKDISKKSD